jgi:hypothetical protein
MPNILVLQPIRPSNPLALRERADTLLARLEGANPGMDFDICQDDATVDVPAHPSKYMRHATVRNYMLDAYLRPEYTHVLWIDSDLVDYPAELPSLLIDAADLHTIVAPLALLAESNDPVRKVFGPNRFYDIGGFIERGKQARLFPPYFEQEGAVIELDSVGCCYLAPADLYRSSYISERVSQAMPVPAVRYAPPPSDYYVEHWSVMQEAKKRGYRVVALSNVCVMHAWLPDYGLGVN